MLATASVLLAGAGIMMSTHQSIPRFLGLSTFAPILAIGPTSPTTANAATAPTLHEAANPDNVVDAANAFLATLSEQQKTTVQVGLTPQNAGRWSNFPVTFVRRNGLFFRDLTPAQVEAALKVARLALSKDGFSRFQEIRAADDVLGKAGGGPGGPGGFGGPGGPGDRLPVVLEVRAGGLPITLVVLMVPVVSAGLGDLGVAPEAGVGASVDLEVADRVAVLAGEAKSTARIIT